jgi:nicotinamidase-related amidase
MNLQNLQVFSSSVIPQSMTREKFPLSSDQMELLLAFEKAGSLEGLSDLMAKDASVVSRRLKEMADLHPVILKVGGRWQITSLGRQINALNRDYLERLQAALPTAGSTKGKSALVPSGSMLILINVQKALHLPGNGPRSNMKAEENILSLLKHWRKNRWPVVHIRHISQKPGSLFHAEAEGAQFIAGFENRPGEVTLDKAKSSAFFQTNLEKIISKSKVPAIVLTGFTAGECIDATARNAKDLEIPTYVIGDGTATFDIVGPTGKLHKAEKVHRSVLANLHANFCDVINTVSVLG